MVPLYLPSPAHAGLNRVLKHVSFTCHSPGFFFYADLVLLRPVIKDGVRELVLGWWYRNSVLVPKFSASC